ncbi:hypothetical protein [Mesobacillus foraminis]|uniref:hypothetical protein n=1 Tax=Mesobacillus foraminis TaxID=279826 RepID=UPI00214BDA68|nr:hypothetical protein [Mesobacillus foraminis]
MEDNIHLRIGQSRKYPTISYEEPLLEMDPELLEKAPEHTVIPVDLPLTDDTIGSAIDGPMVSTGMQPKIHMSVRIILTVFLA